VVDQHAERLLKVHNVRAFEAYLSVAAAETRAPLIAWASATVAAMCAPVDKPVVVVLIGLRPRAWFALGLLHVLAWWRVRRAIRTRGQGYRVCVRFA